MMKVEHKEDQLFRGLMGDSVNLELKEISEEGEFEGYASIFGEIDRGGDIVERGAYAQSLAERPASEIKLLWQHNVSDVRGRWLEVREDDKGLFCRGKLFLSMEKGRDAYTLVKEKAIDGLSIGYRTVVGDRDRNTGVRHLKQLELFEVSLVTFPMQKTARIHGAKAEALPTVRQFEEWLTRDAGFTSRMAKAIIADGYKALHDERDAPSSEEQNLAEVFKNAAKLFR